MHLFACLDGPEFDAHQVDFEQLAARNRAYLTEEQWAIGRRSISKSDRGAVCQMTAVFGQIFTQPGDLNAMRQTKWTVQRAGGPATSFGEKRRSTVASALSLTSAAVRIPGS